MLVSHTKKFIYLKTKARPALSVERHFEKYCMPEGEWTPWDKPSREVHFSEAGIIGARGPDQPVDTLWSGGLRAEQMKYQLGDEIWDSYTKFGVIQNPYTRAMTAFYRNKIKAGDPIQAIELEQVEFENWLTSPAYSNNDAFISLDGATCLFDNYIKAETLDEDMLTVCEHLGVVYDPEGLKYTSRLNPPAEITVQLLYTAAAKDIVAEKSKLELTVFNYSFPTA
jgi:hypothetical protein